MVTPKLLTALEQVIVDPATATDYMDSSRRCGTFVPMTMASDLSGFSDRPLQLNHSKIASAQRSMTLMESRVEDR